MNIDRKAVERCLEESREHLEKELLPFWLERAADREYGGFLTHFDKDGKLETEKVEKTLIAQTRTIYTMSSAHRAGYGGGQCAELAEWGFRFLMEKMHDDEHGGFYWIVDRAGKVTVDKKIVYGLSFAIYALSEYTLATGDARGLAAAEETFDLLQKYAVDSRWGGYFEMFARDWELAGPGSAGGDRKTLDCHMHLMEAFTTLLEASGKDVHRRKLSEDIGLLTETMFDGRYGTGIPQFTPTWTVVEPIKFDVVWGWDRFPEGGKRAKPKDNTSYGHNVEFAWLLLHALRVLGTGTEAHGELIRKAMDHAVENGVDWELGGVYVEGPASGGVYDRAKEFWQQAEMLIGMLDGVLLFGDEKYWKAYVNVHRFVMDKMVNHGVGEWWPLMTREGELIWTHMSHSWKVNYHTVRAMVQSIERLKKVLGRVRN